MPPGIERFTSHDGQGDVPRQIIGQQSVQTGAEGVTPVIGSAQPAERLPARKVPVLVPQASRKTEGFPPLAISDNHEVSVEVPHGIIETVLFTQEVKQEPVEEQVRDVIDRIRNGIPISWAEVSGPTKKGLLERIAADEGTGIPASMLESSEFEKKRDLLGGHSLRGLYTNAEAHARNAGEDTMTVLHRAAGLKRTAEDVVTAVKLDRKIRWKYVPDDTKAEIMQRAGEQTGIPAALMGPGDFEVKYDFLGGRPLNGLYSRFILDAKAAGQSTPQHIAERTGLVPSGDDVVQAMQHDRDIDWKRIPREAMKDVIERVGRAETKPASLITYGDLAERRDIFGGKSLIGLYEHVYNTVYVNKPVDDPRDTIEVVLDHTGITVTGMDVINALREGKDIFWQRVPPDALRQVLVTFARDDNINLPASLLRDGDFERAAHSFRDRGLSGLYSHATDVKPEDQSPINYLMERAGLKITTEDVVAAFKRNRQIPWERVPGETINGLLMIISQTTDINPAALGFLQLRDGYQAFGGKSLRGLFEYAVRHKRDDQTGITYLKEKAGIPHIPQSELGALRNLSFAQLVKDIEFLMPLGIRSTSALARELVLPEDQVKEGLDYIRSQRNKIGS